MSYLELRKEIFARREETRKLEIEALELVRKKVISIVPTLKDAKGKKLKGEISPVDTLNRPQFDIKANSLYASICIYLDWDGAIAVHFETVVYCKNYKELETELERIVKSK